MRIIDNTVWDFYEDVEPGEVFRFEDEFFIKIDVEDGGWPNAVELDCGTYRQFVKETEVIRYPNAELHIIKD